MLPSLLSQQLYSQQQRNLTHPFKEPKYHFPSRRLSPAVELNWDWLPGFTGGNGPIFGLASGRGAFDHCLFIAGAFNNGPPIVLWVPQSHSTTGEAQVIPLGSADDGINGLITSVAQVPPAPPSSLLHFIQYLLLSSRSKSLMSTHLRTLHQNLLSSSRSLSGSLLVSSLV
jgi:hypothetical protein